MEGKDKGLSKSHWRATYRDLISMYLLLIGHTDQEKGSKLPTWISWTSMMYLSYSQNNHLGGKCGFLIIYFLHNDYETL